MENSTKRKLREGKPVVGSGVYVDEISTLQIMAQAGFDFLAIDLQHGTIPPQSLYRVMSALSPTESEIIVRVLWNDVGLINQVVDLGADGVIAPLANTVEDFERAVAAAKYPPDGIRSYGPWKTERYGGLEAYHARANDEILVLPQIETMEAVGNIDQLLEVKGIDGIMVGPADLALSMGLSPEDPGPEHEKMIAHILSKCQEHSVPFGIFTEGLEDSENWLSRGGQICMVGMDLMFVEQGAAQAVRGINEMLGRLQRDP